LVLRCTHARPERRPPNGRAVLDEFERRVGTVEAEV
jgi:hypothetical protein